MWACVSSKGLIMTFCIYSSSNVFYHLVNIYLIIMDHVCRYCFVHSDSHAGKTCKQHERETREQDRAAAAHISQYARPCPGCKQVTCPFSLRFFFRFFFPHFLP